jgi:hypothetical protein
MLLRRRFVRRLGYARLLVALSLVLTPAIAQSAGPAELISNYRLRNGEGRVNSDSALNKVAQEQATAMAARNLLDHNTALAPFTSRVASLGSTRAAENIAYGYDDFPRTLDQWINSSGHRKNLLMPEGSRIGVAKAKSPTSGQTYWAMVIAGGYKSEKTSPAAKGKTREIREKTCRIAILGMCL